MKKILLTLALSLIGILAFACEIEMKVSEKQNKDAYAAGDIIVVEVQVAFDHRDCNVDISESKFTAKGCKILGATKWTQSKANTYHRKLQVKILPESKSANIVCKRTCDKEGGHGKLTLKVE